MSNDVLPVMAKQVENSSFYATPECTLQTVNDSLESNVKNKVRFLSFRSIACEGQGYGVIWSRDVSSHVE